MTQRFSSLATALFVLVAVKLTVDFAYMPTDLDSALAKAKITDAAYHVVEGRVQAGGARSRQIRIDEGGVLTRIGCGNQKCDSLPVRGQARITYFDGAILIPNKWLLELAQEGKVLVSLTAGEYQKSRWLLAILTTFAWVVAGGALYWHRSRK